MKFDLKYFILRTNVLILYREAIKFAYSIKDVSARKELLEMMRNDIESSRRVENRKQIEYDMALGRKKLNNLKETYMMSN